MAREWSARAALAAGALALAAARLASADPSQAPRLLGTVVSSDAARSLAVIEQGGARRVIRTGGEFAGGTVVEIRSDSVRLRRGGRLETWTLADVSRPYAATGSVPASPDTSRLDGAPRAADSRPSSLGARAASASSRAGGGSSAARRPPAAAKAKSEADLARSNDQLLADLAAQARFAPVMGNDGKLRGVAVMNVVPDGLIERLGLRSDDVVTAIQGVPIDSSGRAMNVARGLDGTSPVKLDIERRGVPTVVVVDPRSLQRR